jgi:energy-coupling factor transporter ATP-binding protein EcfA2
VSVLNKTKLKTFYNRLEDRPLDPALDDDAVLYEPYLEQQPDHDPIRQLATRISWSEAASVNLLSGQRGSGKSTELRRLRKYLQEEEGCVVLLCDMRDYLNLTKPVEITDFLISLMVGVNLEIRRRYQSDPGRRSYWERLIEFLQREVKIEDLTLEGELGGGKIGISASLKDDPSFKACLQDHLKGHVSRIVKQAQEFTEEAMQFIRNQEHDPDKKVVLLVDSVEQIRGVGEEAQKVHHAVAELFSAHADKLRLPMLHVVYTIPPYLTPLAPGLGAVLGGNSLCNLPSVHIRNRDGRPDPNGLDTMRHILRRRYADYSTVFSDDQVDRMTLATGGDFRNFFRLVRDCLIKASASAQLPVADTVVTDAENHLLRDMLPIAEDDKVWLRKIAATKAPELSSNDRLPQLARFFDTHLVLNYRNGEDWYDIHPLLNAEIGS